jgi:Modulator of levamisole receptor-1
MILYYGDASSYSDDQQIPTTFTSTDRHTPPPSPQQLQYRHHHPRRTWTKEAYPNPMRHPIRCRSSIGYICDPDGILVSSSLHSNNKNYDDTTNANVQEQLEMRLRSFSQYTYYYTRNNISNTQQQQQQQQQVHIQIYVAFVRKVIIVLAYFDLRVVFILDFADYIILLHVPLFFVSSYFVSKNRWTGVQVTMML